MCIFKNAQVIKWIVDVERKWKSSKAQNLKKSMSWAGESALKPNVALKPSVNLWWPMGKGV